MPHIPTVLPLQSKTMIRGASPSQLLSTASDFKASLLTAGALLSLFDDHLLAAGKVDPCCIVKV